MELRQLRYFVAVARESHFTRAAERLGIAQPPLSQQIQALERELGVALFDRSNRHVALTAAGVTLLTRVEPLLAALEETQRAVQTVADEERGQVTVAALPTAAGVLFPPALIRFRARYPHIALRVAEGGSTTVARFVRAGEADFGVLRLPIAAPALAIEPLLPREEDYVLVVAPHHPLARRKCVPLAALADEPFLLTDRTEGAARYDALIAACQAAGFTPRVICDGARYETIVRLVAAGLGVTLLPRLAVGLAEHAVAAVDIETPIPAGSLAIVSSRGRTLSPPSRALAAELQAAARAAWQRYA